MKLVKIRWNNDLRKYFSFFEFYYYVLKKSPKRYSLAHGNIVNHLVVLMTPLVLWLLTMILFIFTGSGWALIIFLLFGIGLLLNLVFTHSVINKAREIEREKRRRIQEEEEHIRRVAETLRNQRERDEQIRRRREEESRRATQHRRKLEAKTENQIIQLYAVLGINPTTNTDVIKKAYRQKAKQHHPDMGGDELLFRNTNKAYKIILELIEENSKV